VLPFIDKLSVGMAYGRLKNKQLAKFPPIGYLPKEEGLF
jgi:hypothetical protein